MIFLLSVVLFSAAAQESTNRAPQAPNASAAGQLDEVQKAQSQQHSFDVLTYWYGANYRTPFVLAPNTDRAANIARNSVEYIHVGSIGMLSNFADVTIGMSDLAEPAATGGSGATEAYVILREGIGLNGSRIPVPSRRDHCAMSHLKWERIWRRRTPGLRLQREHFSTLPSECVSLNGQGFED
jgi:hypothetical protein